MTIIKRINSYYGQAPLLAWHDPLLQQTVPPVGQDPWVEPSPAPFDPATFTHPPQTPIVPTVDVPHNGLVASYPVFVETKQESVAPVPEH